MVENAQQTELNFDADDPDVSTCVDAVVAHLKAKPGPKIPVAFARLVGDHCVVREVPVAFLATALTDIGRESVRRKLPDVQVWLQRRTEKAGSPTAVHGAIIDIDRKTQDAVGEVERAGVPLPQAVWPTRNGFKLAYAFDRQASPREFEHVAQYLTLAFKSGDVHSFTVTQGQHLPVCLKTVKLALQSIDFPATQTNGSPLQLSTFPRGPPPRIREMLADQEQVSPGSRAEIEAYLESLDIPVPEDVDDEIRYTRCILGEHDSRPCYVRRGADGHITVMCFASHGGLGRQRWSEKQLANLAVGAVS